jgi:hypothetical protein
MGNQENLYGTQKIETPVDTGVEKSPAMSEALDKLQPEIKKFQFFIDEGKIDEIIEKKPAEIGPLVEMANKIIDIAEQLKDNPKVTAFLSGSIGFSVAVGLTLTNPEGLKLALGQIVIAGTLLTAGVLGSISAIKESK